MLEWMFTAKRLIDYIDANAISNPSLTDIAKYVGYSTYHCSELFHQAAGMTIREYISKRKLYAAAMALQKTQDAIIHIALDCGFSSQQALTRAFHKAFGCSPATFRRHPEHFSSTIIREVEVVMESREVFDLIPEAFDKYRPRYSPELFDDLIRYANIDESKSVLELGPGTGQATDPILNTGCDYHCIELGKHLAAKMSEKYGRRENFHIVRDDFITHDFGEQKFDIIYSARTIQWIPEDIAFSKTFELLQPGGILAMIHIYSDYKTPNPALYERIQKVYAEHYRPVTAYQHRNFQHQHAVHYGYVDFERREYHGSRRLNADEYISLVGTHSDHITIPEPHKTPFFAGLRQAVMDAGNVIEYNDTHVLMLARKPLT